MNKISLNIIIQVLLDKHIFIYLGYLGQGFLGHRVEAGLVLEILNDP